MNERHRETLERMLARARGSVAGCKFNQSQVANKDHDFSRDIAQYEIEADALTFALAQGKELETATKELARYKALADSIDETDGTRISFAALCDSIDSKQLEGQVYDICIWHIRRAEKAEAALAAVRGQTCETCKFAGEIIPLWADQRAREENVRMCTFHRVNVPLTTNGQPFGCRGWEAKETEG